MWIPDEWSDVEALVGGCGESESLELKQALPTQAHDIPKAIAAMSKRGGTIVYGVAEDKALRLASAITPIAVDGAEERIRGATANVDPRVEFEVRVLRSRPDLPDGVIAVVVPPSPDWPHMVGNRYPVREGTTTRYLTDAEAQSALGARHTPRLSIVMVGPTGRRVKAIEAQALRPWPVDPDRIVANEIADAEQTLALRTPALDMFLTSHSPLAGRPTKAAHARARQEFRDRLPEYGRRLRAWLEEYTAAARARADTFELTLEIENAPETGHAEEVEVVLELPPTVAIVEERASMTLPPEAPRYHPPRPQSVFDPGRVLPIVRPIDALSLDWTPSAVASLPPEWRERDSGRVLEVSAGNVHASRSVALGGSFLVRADGPGHHELRWRAYTKSARQPTTGTLTLSVPPDPHRPAFGRLRGVTSYPDVPLYDDEDDIVHQVRTADPPLAPDSEGERNDSAEVGGSITRLLRERRSELEWRALGLDPADDGPLDKTTPDDVRRVEP